MNKIYCLVGPSGSGKSTIEKKLCSINPNINRLISHTTRQKRVGEEAGIDYHFITKDVFNIYLRQDQFLQYVKYQDEYYGINKNDIDINKNNIVIVEPTGYIQFLKTFGSYKVKCIFINASEDILIKRMLNREKEINMNIVLNRFQNDKVLFKPMHSVADIIINNNNNLDESVKKINDWILSHE